jgi:hypothetical protein
MAKLRYYPVICLERLRKNMNILSQDSWSLGHDFNPGLLEYEAECYSHDRNVLF